jgi:NAD(P)H-dependent FMN reductase
VKRLLFVHHTVSPATHALYLAAMEGVGDPALAEVDVMVRPALSATASDVLEADGYLLGTPANLGYLSGALKHFFDQIYYPCLEATQRRPFGAYIHSNSDAAGALRALSSITSGLQWRLAQAPVVVGGEPGHPDLDAVKELASAVAARLLLDA